MKGRRGWHDKAPIAPKPLYGLNRLSHAAPDATVLLCEGEKAADAAMHLFPDHVALSWMGGCSADAQADLSPLTGHTVIIWGDADKPGRDAAARLAKRLPAARMVDTDGLPPGFDAADLIGEADPEAWLKRRAERRGTPYGRLLVLGMADLDTAPARSYLLKGLISAEEISIWVGPPKCGKSFLLLHVSYMLSLRRSVFGKRVKQATVLYVAAEGEGGIAGRIRALRARHGASPAFHFIAQPADLLHHDGDLDHLVAAAKAIGATLIALDTLSRLMAGGDENSPVDMGTFVKNVAELRERTRLRRMSEASTTARRRATAHRRAGILPSPVRTMC